MRVLRAILLLAPLLAFAGWRSVGNLVPVVTDVQMVDAGVVLGVSELSGARAWRVTDAGVTTLNTLAGNFVGGGYYAPNCLLGMDSAGLLTPSAGCGTPTQIAASGSWLSFNLLSSPPLAVAVRYGPPSTYFVGPGATGAWTTVSSGIGGSPASSTVQTRAINGIDYTALNTGIGVRVSVDGGTATPVNPVVNTSSWRDAAPFPLGAQPAILGVTTTGALLLIPDYRTPVLVTPSIPASLFPTNVGMSGVTGMVTTATGVLLSPIPNPARIAETWVVRPGPVGQTLVGKIHCIDDRYCATKNAAGDVWMWKNEVPPTVSVMVPQFVGGQTVRLFADAGDGDGDPIYVSWDGGAGGTWANVAGVDDGTQIDFTMPLTCTPFTLDITVADGLAGHERSVQIPVTPMDRGEVAFNAPAQVLAGGPPVSIGASVDGGCSTATFAWSSSDGQTGTGPAFSWVPPATECSADGGVTITATSSWQSGMPVMTTSTLSVAVTPWGAPDAPVFATPGSQQSGTVVDWLSSGREHVCSTTTNFPGTALEWTFDAGATTVTEIDGGLRIDAPRCASAPTTVTGSAIRRVSGEMFGRQSAAGQLLVNIVPDAPPLNASTDFEFTVQGDAGVVFGSLGLDAGCQDERAVDVHVMVFNSGSFVIDGGFRPLDGGWALPVPGGCSGGTFDVIAELRADGGPTGAREQGTVTLPFSAVILGAQTVDRLEVVCGAGARGTVALIPEPNACGAAEVSWRATSGPALVTMSGSGETFDLQTQATDFSSVGQQLTIEWSADAGAGNADAVSHSIELSVQPFLEVSVKARPPLRREEEAVALDVTLRNTTECAVEGLSVTLPLSGGSPIPESVFLDGVPTPARVTDEGLVVDGVSVPSSGFTTIQLSARARLLSSPTIQPVASLRGYVVSTIPAAAIPGSGCSCSQVDLSALLGALVLLFRRRRS